jgi:hypothetical protein
MYIIRSGLWERKIRGRGNADIKHRRITPAPHRNLARFLRASLRLLGFPSPHLRNDSYIGIVMRVVAQFSAVRSDVGVVCSGADASFFFVLVSLCPPQQPWPPWCQHREPVPRSESVLPMHAKHVPDLIWYVVVHAISEFGEPTEKPRSATPHPPCRR